MSHLLLVVGALLAIGALLGWSRERSMSLAIVCQVGLLFALVELGLTLGILAGWEPGGPRFDDAEPSPPKYVRASGAYTSMAAATFPTQGWAPLPGEDRPRILFMGDSFTAGEGVSGDHRFSHVVGKQLGEQGRAVEIINTGIPGLSFWDVSVMAEPLRWTAPDLIVWTFVLNDFGAVVPSRPAEEGGWDDFVVDRTVDMVRGGPHLWRWIQGIREARATTAETEAAYQTALSTSNPRSFERAQQELSELTAWMHSRGGEVLFVVFPLMHDLEAYPFEEAHEALISMGTSAGAQTLDLLPAFRGEIARDLWVSTEDHHPNVVGHERAAEALTAAITPLLRKASLPTCDLEAEVEGLNPAKLARLEAVKPLCEDPSVPAPWRTWAQMVSRSSSQDLGEPCEKERMAEYGEVAAEILEIEAGGSGEYADGRPR